MELRDPNDAVIGAGQAQIYADATHAVYHVNGTVMSGTWSFHLQPAADADYLAAVLSRPKRESADA